MDEFQNNTKSAKLDILKHAKSWIEAWNVHNIDAILDHYSDNVEFRADTVKSRWGRVDGLLKGKSELRKHFSLGLQLAPHLKFDLEEVFTCPGGYAILYHRENGNRVIDVVNLDSEGKANEVRAYYSSNQI